MDCRTAEAFKFKRRLGFKLHHVFKPKQQTVVGSIKDIFGGENMQAEYYVLGYRIDLYFYQDRLAIEINEFGHWDRDTEYENERGRILKKELNCVIIMINPEEEDFNILKAINEIHKHIIESTKTLTEEVTKKSVTNDIRATLAELSLEFEKNTKTIHKFLKRAFKRVVPKA